jgi:pectin methylesterase-like acyl-CoA thioesterase
VPHRVVVASVVAVLVAAVPAQAKTLQVCKDDCKYKKIQAAVNASGKGDTVKVQAGTYNEGVLVIGHKHDKLKLQGNPGNPM